MSKQSTCRHCGHELSSTVLDLGFSPPSNAYLTVEALSTPEITLPLRLSVCPNCFLLQTHDYAAPDDLFDEEYAYFSSTSASWLDHAARFADQVTSRFGLDNSSLVIEVASNDGYLLKNFVRAGIPCLGIEPTKSTAEAARAQGIKTIETFFGVAEARRLAKSGRKADLICANNVYAHVPDLNDFTAGLALCLKQDGVITIEAPHVLELLHNRQFDTVYHEHFSYLSLGTIVEIFRSHGLRVFDVERLATHGGSLRVYGCHETSERVEDTRVEELMAEEERFGLRDVDKYRDLQSHAESIKHTFLNFLLEKKKKGETVAAYGAAAKGNTLLNFSGVKPDLIPFVCDAAKSKQGKFLPGSHIPILAPDELTKAKPDWVIIFPWNIGEEIISQNSELVKQGTKFVSFIPSFMQWNLPSPRSLA